MQKGRGPARTIPIGILMLGDSMVGKSEILKCYCNDGQNLPQNSNDQNTIGIDFKTKIIANDKRIIKLQLWDTAGQERFRGITANYYRKAQGIVVMYDVTAPATFSHVRDWLNEIRQHAVVGVLAVLVGNKCDLTAARAVSREDGLLLAAQCNCEYFETSAVTGDGVVAMFETLADLLYVKRYPDEHAIRVDNRAAKRVANRHHNSGRRKCSMV